MPRFFDDYSNTYLTHDSAAGRKQQRRGWKFRENFKLHYQKELEDWRSGPMGLASAQQAFIRSAGPNNGSVPPLPQGWTEEYDEATKATYYIEEQTNSRSWVRPGFFPPGPGGGGMNMNMGGPPPPGNMQMGGPGHGQRGPPPARMNMQNGPPPSFRGPPPLGGPPPPMFVPPPNLPPPGSLPPPP